MFHHHTTVTSVRILRRLFGSVAFGALVVTPALTSTAASAQAFPSKPVKLVVPYPAGGFPDTVARVMAKALTEKWNQQVVIDNRPGGNGAVGTNRESRARRRLHLARHRRLDVHH